MQRNEQRRTRYMERKAKGICVRCEREAEKGKTMCRECAAAEYDKKRRKRMQRAAEGKCSTCGGGLENPEKYMTCAKCREHFRILNARSRAKRRAEERETV